MMVLLILWKRRLHRGMCFVPIKNIVISYLKRKQRQLMENYKILEDAQGEYPELYSWYQKEMDRVDMNAELIRRKIFELEGQ